MTSPKDWLLFAENDLKTAKAALADDIPSNACFMAQQTVEKSLKGLIFSNEQDIPKTHDLLFLLRRGGLTQFKEECLFLDKFYMPTRYPDAVIGSLPEGLPDKTKAKQAVEYAEQILSFIKEKIQ